MIEELLEVDETTSWEEVCKRFGEFLGLETAVQSGVLRRAMEDPLYAHDLITSRNTPGFLAVLLRDPQNNEYEPVRTADKKSTAELVAKASEAFFKWGKAGFSTVDDETFEQRWSACTSCEHLSEPPDQLAYKIIASKKSDRRVCNACGCVASRKAKLPTEKCPVASPVNPGMNRWGQPMANQARPQQ